MKNMIAAALAFGMCVSLCACGGEKKAFEASKVAYNNIDTAYEITEQFGSDIYEAWRLAIYEDEEVLEDGVIFLAEELSLSEDELTDGIAYIWLNALSDEEWESASEETKESYRDYAEISFELMEEDLFSFCVDVVSKAYMANGKCAEAKAALDEAKAQMKELSAQYSDYEHYPNLKGYYTTTSSFFEFCSSPTGSFEQVKETVNNYRNEARDYISDLDYIFEE